MLLGEGVIERKIFELFLLKYDSNMEKNDVEFAIVDGKIFFPIIISVLNKLEIKVLSLYDLDAEKQLPQAYLNKTIGEISTSTISFKPQIEEYLNINKEMYKDKYRGSVILMSEFYLEQNEKLFELLEKINSKLNEIKQI